MHKKVNNIVRRTNIVFAENPGNLRNGCLIFWKLGQPTLPDGLVRLLTYSQKLFANRILARSADRPSIRVPADGGENGGSRREWGQGVGHNFASRAGDQVRKLGRGSHASQKLGFLALGAGRRFRPGDAHGGGRLHERQRRSAPLPPPSPLRPPRPS